MKKLIALLFLVAFTATSFAQRFGTSKNQDNTGRVLTYALVTTADVAGADTIKLNLNAFETFVKPSSVVDSLTYSFSSVSNAKLGDRVEFLFINSSGSGHKIKFVNNVQVGSSGASITLTSSKRANISFVFDGVYWVEEKRLVQ